MWVDCTATALVEKIQAQDLTVQEIVEHYLAQIARIEPIVQAWEYFDPGQVRHQANQMDQQRAIDPIPRPLQGIPIAIKDIFATTEMPTGWGTPIRAGQQFDRDATVVSRLRQAGAILLGKTVTTEYATARAGKTRNPHQLQHTPGGSSSGSAAAVAAGMVPLAIGSQTMGSVIRPAAYCGVIGFKPSFGLIPRTGAMPASRDLDHVGCFGRRISDIERLCAVLAGPDGYDPDCIGRWDMLQPNQPLCGDRPNALIFIRSPFWEQVDAEYQERLMQCISLLQSQGISIESIELPDAFQNFQQHAMALMATGLAFHHGADYDRYPDQFSPKLAQLIEQGRTFSALDYAAARQAAIDYNTFLTDLLSDDIAILTPATTGTAPFGFENTGSPLFCVLWTFCGLPAISLPIGKANNGLPLAIQMVGQRMGDRRLLQQAEWVLQILSEQWGDIEIASVT